MEKIVQYFSLVKKYKLFSTAYLFIGRDFSLVKEVVKVISCLQAPAACGNCWDCRHIEEGNHPDIYRLSPAGVSIGIDEIRDLQKFLILRSFRLSKKIALIEGADVLGEEAANAFLKTLEEPPPNSLLILCAEHQQSLLPTIISRCKKIYLPCRDYPFKITTSNYLDNLFSRGEVSYRFPDRKRFIIFLKDLLYLFHSLLLKRIGAKKRPIKDYEMMEKYFSLDKHIKFLEEVINIYSESKTVSQNLALNIVSSYFKDRRF